MFYMVFVGYIWLHLLYLIWFVLRSVLRWLPRKSLCGLGWHTHTATMSTLLYHFCRECAWQPQWLKERDVPQQGLRKVLLLTDHAMGGRHSCSKEREGCWRGNQIYGIRPGFARRNCGGIFSWPDVLHCSVRWVQAHVNLGLCHCISCPPSTFLGVTCLFACFLGFMPYDPFCLSFLSRGYIRIAMEGKSFLFAAAIEMLP